MALVQSRYPAAALMDTTSKFFFRLEKKNSQRRSIPELRWTSRAELTEPAEIRRRAARFYTDLDSRHFSIFLESFGLSPGLIAMIQVLYQDVESVLKNNGALSAPFKVSRGVRQGCPLSGMLYSISIKPKTLKVCF